MILFLLNELIKNTMAKTEKKSDAKFFYGEKPERDFKPTGKDLKIEETVENMEKIGIAAGRLEKDVGDTAPKRIIDVMKELALYAKKEVGREKPSMPTFCFDKRYGRIVRNEMFAKEGGDDVEFIIRDNKTGEILESKNIKFMNELPPELFNMFEKMVREGYPGEKSN